MNFMTDSEWLHLVDIIAKVNGIDEDREFRRAILESLRILIPYDSAAFFLTDRSKVDGNDSSFLADPVGVDVRAGKLEEYIDSAWESDELRDKYSLTSSTIVRESDYMDAQSRSEDYYQDFLDEMYVVSCNLACPKGPLGSFNLNRRKEHGDFSDKEVQILRILEPHITTRLQRHQLERDARPAAKDDFYRAYRITSREQDIVQCLLQGMRNDEISAALCISPGTTKKHLENIFKKTGVGSRLELMLLLQREQLA